jgi:hypothetical protein
VPHPIQQQKNVELPSASAATCEEAVQWISPGIDTACKNDDGSYRCGAAECHGFLSVQVEEYTEALKTCSGAYADYADLHDMLRLSLLETATNCGVELGLELTSCEVGMQMMFGIDAYCPQACSDCEEDCNDEVLRPCEENECSRTPNSCAASGLGKCPEFLDKWSNKDKDDIKAVMAGMATCPAAFTGFAGMSDLIIQHFKVMKEQCNGICGDEGNDDFTYFVI